MKKKNIRLIIDITMAVLLPMLMAYSLIGETFHEVVGTIIFVLFIVHQILNRKWYGALFKGKYNAGRIFRTVLNLLLLVFMILQPVSGILLSKSLYTFLPVFPVSTQERGVHLLLAYWGYILMCVHAGTHLMSPLQRLRKRNRRVWSCLCAVLGAASVYGGIAFRKRGFPVYLFGKTAFAFFDYDEPIVCFFLDYGAIMVLCMMAGYLMVYGLSQLSEKRKANTG